MMASASTASNDSGKITHATEFDGDPAFV